MNILIEYKKIARRLSDETHEKLRDAIMEEDKRREEAQIGTQAEQTGEDE